MNYWKSAALALAIALAAFACGSSSDDPTPTGGTGGTSSGTGGTASGTGGAVAGGCTASSPAPGPAKGSCTMTGILCQEYVGSQWDDAQIKSICDMLKGTIGTAGCDKTGATGICQMKCGPGEFVQYVYDTTTGMDKTKCETDGGKWLGP